MDNLSVRSKRNFHNLVVKPNHMHLLDKPNGYASAMVKSSLAHQMRLSCSETTRVSRLAGRSSPTTYASQAGPAPLPANASARALRCFWTCAVMPSKQQSCTSGARGSTSC